MGKKLSGQIVTEYLLDERWANLPSLTLAKKIYAENKGVWNSIDSVRARIRYFRAALGKKNRETLNDKRFLNYRKLPTSEEADYFPFIFPNRANNILCLSDVHVPYHSIMAVNTAIEYGIKENVNAILLNGDIMDCHQGSKYNPDPRTRDLAQELEDTRAFLKVLRDTFKNAYIFYKLGNHENRLEKYLLVHAPALLNVPEFQLSNLLRFGELNIYSETVKDQEIQIGGLKVYHGHEIRMGGGVNVARALFMKLGISSLCGHFHRSSEYSYVDGDGKIITCWSQGHMGESSPAYLRKNQWNMGFSHVRWDKDYYHVRNIRINKDGTIL